MRKYSHDHRREIIARRVNIIARQYDTLQKLMRLYKNDISIFDRERINQHLHDELTKGSESAKGEKFTFE